MNLNEELEMHINSLSTTEDTNNTTGETPQISTEITRSSPEVVVAPQENIYQNNIPQVPYQNNVPQQAGQPTHMYTPIQPNQIVMPGVVNTAQPNLEQHLNTLDQTMNNVEEVTYASKTVEFGQPASSKVIENLKKIEIGEQVRMTLLATPNEVRMVHKVETAYGQTKVVCWSNPEKGIVGACCKDSDAKPRYFFPVMVYPTMPGNINMTLPGGVPELRLLIIWDYGVVQSLYNCISSQGGDFTKVDLIASAMDNFGRLQFFPAQQCNREQFTTQINNLTEFWNQNKDKINGNFGRLLNDQKYSALVTQANVTLPQMQNYSPQDMFGQQSMPTQYPQQFGAPRY